ncbi:MAG: hypothetical protein RBS46_14480 [Methyloversatilis sp.]|jgi:hypothetical protein|nr:hypothetical protein [Methyloversatilis sp.]
MDALYSELKPDVGAVANPLFELSEKLLRKLGNFLPHAVALTEAGEVRVVAAAPDQTNDKSTSVEVLPLLHDGLRQLSRETPLKAVGVAENVTVALEGQNPTKAIKVQFEHKRGLVVGVTQSFAFKHLERIQKAVAVVAPMVEALPIVGPAAKRVGLTDATKLSSAIVAATEGTKATVIQLQEAIRKGDLREIKKYGRQLEEAVASLKLALRNEADA